MSTRPTDELRAAAEKIRALTAPVTEQHPGPWTVHNPNGYPQAVFSAATDVILCETLDDLDQAKTSAPYIAAMHPGLALAVADWLRDSAVLHLPDTECGYCDPARNPKRLPCPALAVARQINTAASA
ncbi:hypothetical protein ACI3K5_23890 [Streptomyces sp. MPA0124]|uniref:hypothetical protein n=1 Tax=Streptomyces sp. MPA0124 TaxID=3378069 RepID=UPI003854AC60